MHCVLVFKRTKEVGDGLRYQKLGVQLVTLLSSRLPWVLKLKCKSPLVVGGSYPSNEGNLTSSLKGAFLALKDRVAPAEHRAACQNLAARCSGCPIVLYRNSCGIVLCVRKHQPYSHMPGRSSLSCTADLLSFRLLRGSQEPGASSTPSVASWVWFLQRKTSKTHLPS